MTVAFPDLAMLLEEVEVCRVEQVSPSFVRFELGSPALTELGNDDGPYLDQRIKLVFPHGDGPVPSFVVGHLATASRRGSAGTCGPTPSATSSAAGRTPGWS